MKMKEEINQLLKTAEYSRSSIQAKEKFIDSVYALYRDNIEKFKDWYDKLSPADKCTVWPPAGSGSGTGLYNMETKDIVDKFETFMKGIN